MSDHLSNTFQQRRQLEQALASLAEASNDAELSETARRIVQNYASEMIVPLLIKRLEIQNSQLRGGLARIATLLPPETIVPALRQYVANRGNAAHGRTSAVTILERFLGESVPGALVADLRASDDAGMQSLREAVNSGKHNRHVLLEYVTQMQEYGPEIALMVLQGLERLPGEDRVELLRLIAQDSRPAVARSALAQLETLASESAAAMRALHILCYASPAVAENSQRTLRKLQFRGQPFQPASAAEWRALLAPADPSGQMAVWLVHMPTPPHTTGELLGFVVSLQQGILHFFYAGQLERSFLPAPQAIGALVAVQTGDGAAPLFVEAPFDLGRWLVQQALTSHWQGEARRPLDGEYKLYNDLIWQFADPQVAPDLRRWLEPTPDALAAQFDLQQSVDLLMAHPAMEAWTLPARNMWHALKPGAFFELQLPVEQLGHMLLRELEREPNKTALLTSLESGLRLQALWYAVAGLADLAERGQALSAAMIETPVIHNPLLQRMLTQGLQQFSRQQAADAGQTN